MKKLLLLSLISCMSIIGFTSATSISDFHSENEIDTIHTENGRDETYNGVYYDYRLSIDELMEGEANNNGNTSYYCFFSNENNVKIVGYSSDISHFPYNSSEGNYVCGQFTITDYTAMSNVAGTLIASKTPITYIGGSNNGGNIIAGGINTFSGTIGRLGEIAGEFIPYMIYIFIGYLGIVLMYKAVKYIIRYFTSKAKGTFGNERVYYNRKQHNYDEKHGQLKPEREYYKK